MKEHYCIGCGGTGEGYIGALAGDGWTGRDCDVCNGHGAYWTDEKGNHYTFFWTGKGPVLRGPDGRFVAWPRRLSGKDK